MDSYGERMTVGEIGDEPPLPRQQEYTEPGRLHTAYSFYLLSGAPGTPELFQSAMDPWSSCRGAGLSWSLGNYDITCFPTRMAGGDPKKTRALMAALIAMRGTIFVYQGDEPRPAGRARAVRAAQGLYKINAYAGGPGRDGCRTPMPWTSQAPMGGFTTAPDAWLPMDPAQLPLSIAAQEGNADTMCWRSRAGRLAARSGSQALQVGDVAHTAAPRSCAGVRTRGGRRAGAVLLRAGRLRGDLIEDGALVAGRAGYCWTAARRSGRTGIDLPAYASAIVRI